MQLIGGAFTFPQRKASAGRLNSCLVGSFIFLCFQRSQKILSWDLVVVGTRPIIPQYGNRENINGVHAWLRRE
jgi:hypothetical protein